MGRGVSSGGGQSSLDYLFGGGREEAPNPKPAAVNNINAEAAASSETVQKPVAAATETPAAVSGEIPAGIPANNANNYFRADGQNCGNFLTDRPSTKVHAAPGGGSSLDYLFGGEAKK